MILELFIILFSGKLHLYAVRVVLKEYNFFFIFINYLRLSYFLVMYSVVVLCQCIYFYFHIFYLKIMFHLIPGNQIKDVVKLLQVIQSEIFPYLMHPCPVNSLHIKAQARVGLGQLNNFTEKKTQVICTNNEKYKYITIM